MVVVATAGLDDLPRSLRESAKAAHGQLAADRTRFAETRAAIEKGLASEPELFAGQAQSLRERLKQDETSLGEAEDELHRLDTAIKANRRTDAGVVEGELTRFHSLRMAALDDSSSVQQSVERAVYDKQHPFDRKAVTGPTERAMVDWPTKKADLTERLAAVHDPASAEALNGLAGQLYVSWDKILVRVNGSEEKVRLVRTERGQVSTEERTEPRQFGVGSESEGMIIQHKAEGKYDSEAERVTEHPALAYVAPPGQSNRYGHWEGDVWHWLPAFIILSHVLHRSNDPITTRDYSGWHDAYRRGVPPPVIGGSAPRRDGPSGPVFKSPGGSQSSSGWWKERPKETPKSWGSGSFGSSQYRSKGGFSGSRFQSRGSYRSFGGGRRR